MCLLSGTKFGAMSPHLPLQKLNPESQGDLVPSTPYNLNRKSYEIIVGFTQKILSVQFFLAEKIDPPSLNYLVQLLAEITISLASQPTF